MFCVLINLDVKCSPNNRFITETKRLISDGLRHEKNDETIAWLNQDLKMARDALRTIRGSSIAKFNPYNLAWLHNRLVFWNRAISSDSDSSSTDGKRKAMKVLET